MQFSKLDKTQRVLDRTMGKTKESIKETKDTIIKENRTDGKEKVSSLDQFLEDDEIDR